MKHAPDSPDVPNPECFCIMAVLQEGREIFLPCEIVREEYRRRGSDGTDPRDEFLILIAGQREYVERRDLRHEDGSRVPWHPYAYDETENLEVWEAFEKFGYLRPSGEPAPVPWTRYPEGVTARDHLRDRFGDRLNAEQIERVAALLDAYDAQHDY